jgi:DNA-binding NarL/FixJ family response regulator
MNSMNKRVLLVNDDAFELMTLGEVLGLRGINIVGSARTPLAAESLFRTLRPDVSIVDVRFNGYLGVALTNQMRSISPGLGVVLTTSCSDLRLLGVADSDIADSTIIVLKRSIGDIDVLCDAIQNATKAKTDEAKVVWINRFPLLQENAHMEIVQNLTNIQINTLRLVAEGLSNGEIAKIRFVSEKSVEQIVARIALHMGIESNRRRNLRVLMTNEFNRWVGSQKS